MFLPIVRYTPRHAKGRQFAGLWMALTRLKENYAARLAE